MGNKLDIGEALNFAGALNNTVVALETSNENIQTDFVNLCETFRDKAYDEFKEEFNAADRTMATLILDIKTLRKSLMQYVQEMQDLLEEG